MTIVLYVEDNKDNVYVLRNRLTRKGYTVLTASDGAQGVAMAATEQPAIILMDVSMPVMNGHQATQAIRTAELAAAEGRHVPIIGVTAHTQDADRDLCLQAGMDDYLSKPISPEILEDKIAQWLGEDIPRLVSDDATGR